MSTVAFDFDGSLALARALWALADELEHLWAARRGFAEAAIANWRGTTAVQFAARTDTERYDLSATKDRLRGEADGWADEWRKAMDQENWNRYAAAERRVKSERGLIDRIGGALFGHDDLPATPAPAHRPLAPDFAPTRSFADYSRY